MYNKIVSNIKEVHCVCDVLSIVNNVKYNHSITEKDVNNILKYQTKDLSIEDMDLLQKIVQLDDDIKNLRLKNSYFEWWLKKIEKKNIEFAEHQAILILHKNRIFNNPLLGDEPQRNLIRKKRNKIVIKNNLIQEKTHKKLILKDEEQLYANIDFSEMFHPAEVKTGSVIFIQPIVKLENMLEMLQNRLKEKEREYENLSFGNKVLWKLEKIKQNINDRDVIREKLKNLYEETIKLKKIFLENEANFFHNYHEKKIDYHELMKNHNFFKIELPKFIFPIINN